jgi:putative methyltransferase (TIGR04325 family)
LTGLLWSNSLHGELNVVDFGGSLGSTYHQNKKFLHGLKHTWNIIEQEAFVSLGKQKYQTDHLRFHESIQACVKTGSMNTFVTSSTLQYLPDPMKF